MAKNRAVFGGAIYSQIQCSLHCSSSFFTNNSAVEGGGTCGRAGVGRRVLNSSIKHLRMFLGRASRD